MTAFIGRREFITLLGGAAAWRLAARAQSPGVPVIGFLDVVERSNRLAEFIAALLKSATSKAKTSRSNSARPAIDMIDFHNWCQSLFNATWL